MKRSTLLTAAWLHVLAWSAQAELPSLPQNATSFGATISDGWVYVYGGNTGKAHEFNRDCIKGDFFRLNPANGTEWEYLPADRALLGASMVSYHGSVYRVGGMEARNEKGAKNDLHSTRSVAHYDPAKHEWAQLADLPEPRSSHDVAILGDVLYVGGGWKLAGSAGGNDSNVEWAQTMFALDLRKPDEGWKSLPQPFQRRALALIARENRLWFIGGMASDDKPSLAVDWYDPRTGTWGKAADLPMGPMSGFGVAAALVGGDIIASPLSGTLYALNDHGARWQEVGSITRPRFFHRLLPVTKDSVLVVGGSNRKEQIRELELVSLPARPGTVPAGSANPAAEPTEAAAWPQWRGPNRDGVSPEKGYRKIFSSDGPPRLWRANVGVGMSSCVVVGGTLYTQGNNGEGSDSVVALDAVTGAERWLYSYPCPTSAHEMPIVPAGPGSTPTVVGNQIFALSREGDLLCLDVSTGALLWQKSLVKDLGGKRPVYGYSQSPLIVADRLILDLGKEPGVAGSTVAIRTNDGSVIWQAGTGEAGYSSARVMVRDGKPWIVMFKGEGLEVIDPADGTVVASYRTTVRDFANAATPAFVGDRILASNTGTDLASLLDWKPNKEAKVQTVWQHKQFALLFNSAIPLNGSLFAFNEKRRGHHEFTCINADTGETRWVSDAIPTSTFILADNHWIFLTREGEVLISPASDAEPAPCARFKALDGKCYATPTLANGRLYVRSNTGEIVAFDLRDGR